MRNIAHAGCILLALVALACDRGGAECPEADTLCGDLCVDTTIDPANCGGCGQACGAGHVCVEGACQCPAGETDCEGRCVRLESDPTSCGACGFSCAAGTVCSLGTCGCGPGLLACDGACTDPAADPANCGTCGNACPAGSLCSTAGCTCATGSQLCGASCLDVSTSNEDCGGCGNACPAGTSCTGGRCACGPGLTECEGECVDVRGDPAHCGSCGNVCGDANPICDGGTCTGTCNHTQCGDKCTDPQLDPRNCGACGAACDAGQTCSGGECSCIAGTRCGEACVDTSSSNENCGACGVACGAGQRCDGGECRCLAGVRCGERCVDTASDEANCGACGAACGAGEECAGGSCGCSSGAACGEACSDLATDEAHCGECSNACASGQQCLGGVCTAGDLFAACFQAGTVVPLLKTTGTPTGTGTTGLSGPQALALLGPGHLVALGALDDTLYVIDRGSMQVVGSTLLSAGSCPNQVVIRDTRAYVVNSCVNTVQVVELANPAAPSTVDEVSTGDTTNPYGAAFDDTGRLWVSLLTTNQLLPIDFSGASGVAGAPIDLPVAEGVNPFPAGVAASGEAVYVALNNLDATWQPAGNGRLATVSVANGTASATLVDLGAGCRNPGFLAAHSGKVHVACTGAYDGTGEVATYETSTGSVVRHAATGGAPSRLSVDPSRPEWVYASDSLSVDVLAIEPGGAVTRFEACPAGAMEFVADVLVAP